MASGNGHLFGVPLDLKRRRWSEGRNVAGPHTQSLQESKLAFPSQLLSREPPGAEQLMQSTHRPCACGELVGAQQGGLPGTDCRRKGRCLVGSKEQLPPGWGG